MKVAEVEEVFARMRRLQTSLRERFGPGCEWQVTALDEASVTVRIRNVRDAAVVKDDVVHLIGDIWDAKDHLRELAKLRNKDPQEVERVAKRNFALQICGDLATRKKHAGMDWGSRSKLFPILGRVTYRTAPTGYGIANPGLLRLTVAVGPGGATTYDFDVDPAQTEVSLPVHPRDESRPTIGDAFEFTRDAVARWEAVLATLN